MSQVIAGIYEIWNEIGAGGGGIVYLGRHLRLEKQVVLKADKRTLNVGMEKLRREVDMLKGLSHAYIPQVYDFVQEAGVVYTVMDYIEGESLDKLLARNERPSQVQVIRWACQLLEALIYLHGCPPHGILHGDIKPANIMIRTNGDVCLIDYNIALALGEDGAVKVGFSKGYASPEHYGMDFISNSGSVITKYGAGMKNDVQEDKTETMSVSDSDETLVMNPDLFPCVFKLEKEHSGINFKSTKTSPHGMMLDVRSDIYSLGATLYHLLAGQRPAQDARQVEPLSADVCSPAVSAIIRKAMEPDPDMRYQTAEEMLSAFRQLFKTDIRVVRHKKRIMFSAVVLTTMFLFGGLGCFWGLSLLEQEQRALAMAEYSANSLAQGDVEKAISQALEAIPEKDSIWNAPVTAEAQKALTDALGVYELFDEYNAYDIVDLPSAPYDITFSADNTRLAVVYAYETAVFDMKNLQKIAVLPMQNSALADAVFVDRSCIVFAGIDGVTAYDLDTQRVLWTGEKATFLTASADGSTVACVDRENGYAVIYDVNDGTKKAECSFDGKHMKVAANDIFADPMVNVFALNYDGSLLAVSFSDGGLSIYDLNDPNGNFILFDSSEYQYFDGEFAGKYFAYTAGGSAVQSSFEVIDTETGVSIGGYESQNHLILRADENNFFLADANLLVSIDPGKLKEQEMAYTGGTNITSFSVGKNHVLAATDDNCFSFFDRGAKQISKDSSTSYCDFVKIAGEYAIVGNRNEPVLRVLKLEDHRNAQLMTYDVDEVHDEARISLDGKTVMLFNNQKFSIYDMQGNRLARVQLPDTENIYDQQFQKDESGSGLEVTWYDGTVRYYSASDGTLLWEEIKEIPSKDLYEEFFVGEYRITSSLHSPPEVYYVESGELAAILEEDSYLTYVTQVGEYLVTEYISSEGERYGLLLDQDFQTLAYLPGLCDIVEDKLIFDDNSGNLRQCRIYSLQELTALGVSDR